MEVEGEGEEFEGFHFDELGSSPICAICDDGGDLLCCDGPCMRSFHGTRTAAAQSSSRCKSLGLTDYEVQRMRKFYCDNCKSHRHQCSVCNCLGRSESPEQEVFMCDVAFCGRFYHLPCVSKLLKTEVDAQGFTCPVHKCHKCGERESFEEEAMRLYPCRRCPRAWHRKCVNSRIKFDGDNEQDNYEDDHEEGREVRGWRVGEARFLFCFKHEILSELNTPHRNHLRFPPVKPLTVAVPKSSTIGVKRKTEYIPTPRVEHYPTPTRVDRTSTPREQHTPMVTKPKILRFKKEEVEDVVKSIMEKAKNTVKMEDITGKLTNPSTVGRTANKNIQHGKILSILRAFQKASQCLARGGKVEEAKCIFPPTNVRFFENLRESLRVYLSPALYGQRYSSYGRHFTQVEKLREIVQRLCCYVENGDMIVDFCCGANDFSRLMFEDLQQDRKFCHFKNFDIIQPQNTFNFEQRDYMTVQRHEVAPGEQLIIGLNPPFGVRAETASRFAEHSATFAPKLIVLIAPPETRSPGIHYELLWKDDILLRGPAFYLPGSTDTNGNVINQENNQPPVLFLWSRKDFIRKHHHIAVGHGHVVNTMAPPLPGFYYT